VPDDNLYQGQEQVLSKSGLQTFGLRIILGDTADLFCPGAGRVSVIIVLIGGAGISVKRLCFEPKTADAKILLILIQNFRY
jgi:Ethanolamine utilization protein EutJ (predicted chaperonin)